MPLTNFVESWVDETTDLTEPRLESLQDLGEFYRQFGSRLPAAMSAGLATTARRLTT
jgi:hypothetical protein